VRVAAYLGDPGDRYLDGTTFREFGRVELNSGNRESGSGTFWYRISNYSEWYFRFSAKKGSAQWQVATPPDSSTGIGILPP
jgi:hypothetical protein